MTTYKCPVCGKQYTDLEKLAECVKADNAAMKRVEAQKAADEARKKAEAARAQTALREKYIKAIKDSREAIEKSYEAFKTQIVAYNKIVSEAKQKTGVIGSTATSTLSFGNVQTSYDAPKSFYDWLDKVEEFCKSGTTKIPSSSSVKDEDDLATVILKSLGI